MKNLSLVLLMLLCLFSMARPCCEEEEYCAGGVEWPQDGGEDATPCSAFYTCGNCPGFIMNEVEISEVQVPVKNDPHLTIVSVDPERDGFTYSLIKPPSRV